MIAGTQERYPKLLLWGILISFVALNTIMLAFEIFYVPLVPALLLFVALAIVDALTAGNLLFYDNGVADQAVGNGDTVRFPAGDLDISMS